MGQPVMNAACGASPVRQVSDKRSPGWWGGVVTHTSHPSWRPRLTPAEAAREDMRRWLSYSSCADCFDGHHGETKLHRESLDKNLFRSIGLPVFRIWICLLLVVCGACQQVIGGEITAAGTITVRKRSQVEQQGQFQPQERMEVWAAKQTAVIVCDVWDAHHSINAVRRVEEMAPRMNQLLENARSKGCLIIHAPSGCMRPYEKYPARLRARQVPRVAKLPERIGEWCHSIPAEEKGAYPLDQSDGGEDDDPAEHRRWHERLAVMGRDPRAPWKRQIDILRIDDRDAISDSGEEVWNLLEHHGIRHVAILGVHTNMCVLGRPFGLRQLSRNGKDVVLVRDLTDTMYNPQRSPYVLHHLGTRRIIDYIEKYICPTITSSDFLGGEPFRFRNDRHKLLMLIGEDEYQTDKTLPQFARDHLEPHGFVVKTVFADSHDRHSFSGLVAALPEADLLLVSVRRRSPPPDQLAAIREHLGRGKPVVGIRTSSHAFALQKPALPPAGHAEWARFDQEVLGGNYAGHHAEGPKPAALVAPGATDHPILVDIDPKKLVGGGSLYQVVPLAVSTTPLLMGTIPGALAEPIAWTNLSQGRSRVFYTSLGYKDDFENSMFQKLLLNGICWTLDIAPPGLRNESAASRNK